MISCTFHVGLIESLESGGGEGGGHCLIIDD